MDQLSTSIPWPAIPVIFGLAVAGVVWSLQKLKMLAWSSKHWTKRIPKWVWLALSIVLPFGLVILLAQPWVFGWLNQVLPESMQVDIGPQEMLGIGVSAVFGGQGAYPLAKKYGMTKDYDDVENGYDESQGKNTQNGNSNTQTGNVSQNTTVSETGNTAKQETSVPVEPMSVQPVQNDQQISHDAGNSIQPTTVESSVVKPEVIISPPVIIESTSGLSDQTANVPTTDTIDVSGDNFQTNAVKQHQYTCTKTPDKYPPVWPQARLLQDVTPDNGKMYYVALEPLEETLHRVQANRARD